MTTQSTDFLAITLLPPCGAKGYGDLISVTILFGTVLFGKNESWYVDHEGAGDFPHRLDSIEKARDMHRDLIKRGWTRTEEPRCSGIKIDRFGFINTLR